MVLAFTRRHPINFTDVGHTLGFSYWVNNFGSYSKIYGSIGTVLVVMTLIYINALILLIGFELNVSIEVLKKEQDQKDYFN